MASDGIEREFKLLLADRRERAAIEALLPPARRRLHQRNVFLDTADRAIGRSGLSLRLRDQDGTWWLTAKGPCRECRFGLSARPEAERQLRAPLAAHVLAGTVDPLPFVRRAAPAHLAIALAEAMAEASAGRPVLPVGEFRNERSVVPVPLPDGRFGVLALDRTLLDAATEQFEIELEVEDDGAAPAAREWLSGLLARAGVPARPAASKRSRFEALRDGRTA
ncbi:MAG: CYTH domain-containing protein [Acetobacteraceae bacterium]